MRRLFRIAGGLLATAVCVMGSAGEAFAQPRPQQPYPPYPQQPYPPPQQYPQQPYYPPQQPYPQQPYYPPQQPYPPQQQYPQQPYYPPQQPYAPGPPPAPTEPAPKPVPTPPLSSPRSASSLFDVGLSFALGISLAHQDVQIGSPDYRSFSGGVFMYGNGIGSLLGASARERVALNIHGGAVGLDTRAAVEAFVGPSARLFDGGSFFVHVGVQGYSLQNDEVRATMLELPATEIGFLFSVGDVAIALGPTLGLVLSTEYVPGDEDQGHRWRRRRTSDLGLGGFTSITWEHFAIDASLNRITAKDPLYVVDGEACIFFAPLALCGFAQYWRSLVTIAQPGLPIAPDAPLMAPTLYLGGAIAIGVAAAASK